MVKPNSHLPTYLLAAALLLLAASAGYIFVQGKRGVAYSIVGALIILIEWFQVRRHVSAWALLPAGFLVAFYISRPNLLAQAAPIRESWTFDIYALYADGSFGFQPSIFIHQLIAKSRLSELFIQAIYEALPVAIGAAYAFNVATRRRWRIFATMVLVAVVGVQCYKLFPICGPAYLPFGNECFYYHGSCSPDSFFRGLPYLISIDDHWSRNGMPSLHMSWALLSWWACREKPFLRWIMLSFAGLTAIATLAYGEHYLIDLLAACPFSVAIWFLCMEEKPVSEPMRMLPLLGGATGFMLWIWVLRFEPHVFHASPVIPWLAAVASVGYLVVFSRHRQTRLEGN